jgi:hypothetical protein
MKVAICFSGLPRFLAETLPYWRNSIIEPYKPSVFVHTWFGGDSYQRQGLTNTLQSYYSPQSMWIQSPETFDTSLYTQRIAPFRTTAQNVISQFTSIQRSLQLCEQYETANNFQFDIVVRARFDWYLKEVVFEINNQINVALTPTLLNHRLTFQGLPYVGISDQFAYGSSDNMRLYGKLADNIPHLYRDHLLDFCGEILLKGHLLSCDLEVKEHRWQNGIVRPDGIMP